MDVGGWAEAGSGQAASLAMPQRYSEAKLDEQASLRRELIDCASGALQVLTSSMPEPRFEEENTLTYSQLWSLWPARNAKFNKCEPEQALTWCRRLVPGLLNTTICMEASASTVEQDVRLAMNTSSESSSGASDYSGTSEQQPADVESLVSVGWQLSKGKKGCLHLMGAGGLTQCGRSLNMPEQGIGVQRALETGRDWSPRCAGQLPVECRLWWNRAHKCNQ